jgi:nucleoside-diphosphate-sugar epimerase
MTDFSHLVEPDHTYLVTGGAGFIGSHLVEHLLTGDPRRVRVVDNFSTGFRRNLAPFLDRIELIEGDISRPEICQEALDGVDIVFHQAALPSVPRSIANPARSHAVNATGTLNILVAAKYAGAQRVVYASSSSTYGDTPTLPKHEDLTPHPLSPYAVAKLAGEHYVRSFPLAFGLEGVALRYFNVFGPRQDPASPYAAVIPLFALAAMKGESPTIVGDGEQTRDFTYIDNVVLANLLAATAPADRVSGQVFNVGCGDRISVNQLWEEIRDILESSVDAVHAPPRSGEVRDSLASLESIREQIGYEVQVGLSEGIRRTVDWLREGAGA